MQEIVFPIYLSYLKTHDREGKGLAAGQDSFSHRISGRSRFYNRSIFISWFSWVCSVGDANGFCGGIIGHAQVFHGFRGFEVLDMQIVFMEGA